MAFVTGFNELIPPDLVNVFDERELELLIGGIADIDVEDWKKHTDYRGYTEQDEVIKNFWTVSLFQISLTEMYCSADAGRSAFGAGTPNKSPASCNSPPAPRAFRSTDSKISRAAMGPADLRLRNRARIKLCRSLILGTFFCASRCCERCM